MKRPLLSTLFYYSEKIPPKRVLLHYYIKLKTFAAAVETVSCLIFEKKKTVKHVEPFMVSWTPLPESQSQKKTTNDFLRPTKRDPFHCFTAQPLHETKNK